MKQSIRSFSTIAVIACMLVMPLTVSAQTELQRRNQTQNEWRTIATVSGAAALLGLLKKDKTLTFAGAAGTLYALYRYDEDSKSKDRLSRTRAAYFSRSEFYRDGVRYNRRVVTKGGQKYYQFYRAPKSQQDWKAQGFHDNRNNEHSNRNHDKHQSNGKGKGNSGNNHLAPHHGEMSKPHGQSQSHGNSNHGAGNWAGKSDNRGKGSGKQSGQGNGKSKGQGGE